MADLASPIPDQVPGTHDLAATGSTRDRLLPCPVLLPRQVLRPQGVPVLPLRRHHHAPCEAPLRLWPPDLAPPPSDLASPSPDLDRAPALTQEGGRREERDGLCSNDFEMAHPVQRSFSFCSGRRHDTR